MTGRSSWAALQRVCLGLLLAALFSGCATLVNPPSASTTPTPPQAQAAGARVLDRCVDDQGQDDFAGLAQDRADLDTMLAFVAAQPAAQLSGWPAQMAHHINAYNALSMFNVIDSGFPASHAGLNKLRFFIGRRFQIGGEWLSLYAYENDIIRPLGRQRADPRLHFALNCSARACPRLPRTPFTATALDAELARETRAFFALPINYRLDAATRTVWLGELLDFYPSDFVPVPAASLLAYANAQVAQPAPADWAVRFTPYDWTVAHQRRR